MAKGQPHLAINILDPVLPKTEDAGLLAMAAEANRQTGQARRAERLLEAAVKFEPKNPELHTSLGIVRLTAGLKQRGIADLEAAVALNPLHARADEALIFALLGEKQVERAEQAVSALEKRLPDRAETHTLRGAVWLAKKDDAKARVSFERALQISPALLPAAEALAEIDTREGKPDAMRQRTEAILKHDSKHLGALLTLARLDAAAGRQAESVARIRLALSAHPNAINAMLMLAQTQLQFGNAAEAVITAQQAAKAYPYDTRAFKVLADAQVAAGDTAGAIVTLTTLTEIQPAVPNWYQHLAMAYMSQRDYPSAENKILKALAMEPASLISQGLLGDIYLRTGALAKANQLAAQIQRERPKAALGYALEGNVLFVRKDYAQAARVLQKAASIEPNGDLLLRIHDAQSLLPGGKPADAPLRDWLKNHPEDVPVRFHLANSYNRMQQYREAAEEYREVLKRMPKDFRVLNNLAWVLHQSGDPKAIEFAEQAQKINPQDASTNDTLGVIMLGQGKFAAATQVLLKAVALDGANPEIRFHLAQALLKVGDTGRARTELRILLAAGKPFPQLEEARALAAKLGG